MIAIRQFRDAIVHKLKDAQIPTILNKVYSSRARKIWGSEESLILVYTPETEFDDQDTAPIIYGADTVIAVEIVSQGGEELDDRLDELTQLVVDALIYPHGSEGPFEGKLEWIYVKSIGSEFTAGAEVLKGSQTVTFAGMWRAILPAETPVDEFRTMGTDLGPPDDAQAEDLNVNFTTDMRT